MIRVSRVLQAAVVSALAFPLVSNAAPTRPAAGDPVPGLRLVDAGRQSGARLVGIDLEHGGAAALQVDLRWSGPAAEVTVLPGDTADRGAKFVEGGWQQHRNYRVVVAGMNRNLLGPGRVAVLSIRDGRTDGDFTVSAVSAVDADGYPVDLAADPAQSSATVRPSELEPWAVVSFTPFAVMPGATTKEIVTIGSGDNANPAAVQIDLVFDPSALTLRSVEAGSASTIASKQVRWSFVSPSVARIIVQGLNTTPIPDGELIKIQWQANSAVPRGTYTGLDCAGTVITNGTGFVIPTTCWSGAVGLIGNRICDVNTDSRVDVGDVQAAINKVVKLTGPAVDVNCNGREDVQDIQQITDGALGLTCPTPGANNCQ